MQDSSSMPSKARVGYLTGEYPRATDTFIQREVEALRRRGLDVQTFAIREPGKSHDVGPEQQAERQRTFYVQPAALSPLRAISDHCSEMLRSPRRYLAALRLAYSLGWPGLKGGLWTMAYFLEAGVLAAELRRRGVRHLHNHFASSSCSVAAIATTMAGLGLSFTEHGPATFLQPHQWHLDTKARLARFVACISDFCRSQMMMFSQTADWAKMHIVHCGVDPSLFAMRTHDGAAKQVLFVGRLAAVKGLPMLLEAWAKVAKQYPKVTLKLVGDGPDRNSLQQQVSALGLANRVIFTGYQSQAQVRQHLVDTDVFVMASFAEGVPVVLMEAMAAGVPVVATRIAGVSELVEDGRSGLLVPPGNAHALAEAMTTLIGDAALRRQFGGVGRAHVEAQFDVNREADKLHRLFMQVIGEEQTALSSQTTATPQGGAA